MKIINEIKCDKCQSVLIFSDVIGVMEDGGRTEDHVLYTCSKCKNRSIYFLAMNEKLGSNYKT